jgi:TolB-like protein
MVRTVKFLFFFALFFKKVREASAMVEETTRFIRIDLNQFKLHLYLKQETELTLHFDTPSRRFYLSVIGLVVHEMKKRGRITSIPLQEQVDVLALLNKTVGASAGSSKKKHLLRRVYRKWKDALPDLENAPLFKVVGRKKRYDESMEKVYGFGEGEKDGWANLFEYNGSYENLRLRFSIDRLDACLDDVIIVYGESPAESANEDAWEGFIAHLKENLEDRPIPEDTHGELKEPELPLLRQRRWLKSVPGRRLWPVLFALIALVVGAAIFVVWKTNLFAPQVKVASVEKVAFPVPDEPSIAVLPFRNLSDDPKQEYFSDGLTDDLITDLSKISGLFIIARNSAFTYKDKSVDIRQVAEELGVRYVLEGSVRRAEEHVRINAQLIDATTGGHLWAERYDGKMENVFALQDRITQKIVYALKVKLTAGEEKQIGHKDTDITEAYDAFLKGFAHYRLKTTDDFEQAIPYLEEAINKDPNYSRAYAALADVYWEIAKLGWEEWWDRHDMSRAEILVKSEKYLQEAMKDPTPLAHFVASDMRRGQGRHQDSITEAARAIALDVGDPVGYLAMARALIWAGSPVEGAEFIKKAMRFDPNYPPEYLHWLGVAQFGMERFEEAATTLEEAIRRSSYTETPLWLAATYGHLGRVQEAMNAIKMFDEHKAKTGWFFYLDLEFVNIWWLKEQADIKRLRKGLAIAGVPPEKARFAVGRNLISQTNEGPEVKGATTIDVTTAKALFDRGVPFVDVRNMRHWSRGHIPRAVHLSLYTVFSEFELSKIVSKDQEVVIHCDGYT